MSNDARYRALVEHSSDILALLSSDGRISYINPSAGPILADEGQSLAGTDLLERVHPDDVETLRAYLAKPDRTPRVLRFQAVGSSWQHLVTDIGPVPGDIDLEGLLLRARVSNSSEPSSEQATLASERMYRELFEESRDAIVLGTLDGEILDINPAGLRLFGFDNKEQMAGLDIANDLYWNPEDRRRAMQSFRQLGYSDDCELELKSRDGRRLRVQESASAIRDDDGNVIGIRAVLRDITEQRRLQEQLRQSQKMEAVGRLAGGVAHDFNNLLTAINGYSELALANLGTDDPQRNAFEEIRKAGKRATDLTRRLLTLSRHQVVSPRRISLNRCVVDMEKLLQRVIGEDIELRTRLDQDLPPIHADQGQLEQIILNLAVNARDAMQDGGALELETRRVRMPADEPSLPKLPVRGDYVMLGVRDTGSGMEKKVMEHAFEPFFTTKGQGHNTGLGLAIVYGIVKQSNGYIEVDSTEGQGTTFLIFFPTHSPKATKLPEQVLGSGSSLPRGSETVLLVEDETSVRTLVRQILENQGYRVLAARNARAASALCDEHEGSPDLLLTDVVMPGRSGLALAEDLQQRFSDIKVLFMSGYTDSHTGVKLLTQRQAAFLPKPFSPEALAVKVRMTLDT